MGETKKDRSRETKDEVGGQGERRDERRNRNK